LEPLKKLGFGDPVLINPAAKAFWSFVCQCLICFHISVLVL